ncbi:MAG: prolipoprotein diacylglyceryl transferase [Solirubrobacteraceae bacterium]
MPSVAVITIGLAPKFHLGPLTFAWHGVMIAVGILVGSLFTARYLKERRLSTDPLWTLGVILTVAGIVGARAYYLILHPAQLADPGDWLGSNGFAFYGGLVLVPAAMGAYLWRRRLSAAYVDATAIGLAFGYAVGRVGDVIAGEHHGGVSHLPWAIAYTHPGAEVPRLGVPYQPGALYEIVLGLAIFVVLWPLRHRLRTTMAAWWFVGLYSLGRFAMFFYRSDSPASALGLKTEQWVSLGLLALAVAGGWWTAPRLPRADGAVAALGGPPRSTGSPAARERASRPDRTRAGRALLDGVDEHVGPAERSSKEPA